MQRVKVLDKLVLLETLELSFLASRETVWLVSDNRLLKMLRQDDNRLAKLVQAELLVILRDIFGINIGLRL